MTISIIYIYIYIFIDRFELRNNAAAAKFSLRAGSGPGQGTLSPELQPPRLRMVFPGHTSTVQVHTCVTCHVTRVAVSRVS